MYKRPDSDIFGTKSLDQNIRIVNDSFVDPSKAFKKKNDENYAKYVNKLGNVGRKNYEGNPEMPKANQKAIFSEEYHKDRKYWEMQSSIFCQQKVNRLKTSHQEEKLQQKKVAWNQSRNDSNYGKRNTLKRQIDSLPYNQSNIKGNSSQLFDFDVKTQQPSEIHNQLSLIPNKMQWDQHDSIRYKHHKTIENPNIESKKPQVDEKQKPIKDLTSKQQNQQTFDGNGKNVVKNQQKSFELKIVSKIQSPKAKQGNKIESNTVNVPTRDIEIRVIKGWQNKFMEGLCKYCKLYSTPMTKFELEGTGKALIYLKRTKKWQAVIDWLTKDAKLKIRVSGN